MKISLERFAEKKKVRIFAARFGKEYLGNGKLFDNTERDNEVKKKRD